MNKSSSLENLIKTSYTSDEKNEPSIISNILSIYSPPVIIITGTIANIFSLIIFMKLTQFKLNIKRSIKTYTFLNIFYFKLNLIKSKTRLKNSNSTRFCFNNKKQQNFLIAIYFYLAVLSVCDLGVLYFGLFNDWISDLNLFNLKNFSSFTCKFSTFLAFLFSHLSSSLIVVTCLLRLIAIYSPIRAAKLTNKKWFKRTCLFLLTFYSCINLHLFWTMKIQIDDVNYFVNFDTELVERVLEDINLYQVYQCQFVAGNFLKLMWPIIDKLVYCLIPFFIITFINVLIIINISKTQKFKHIVYVSKLKSETSGKIEFANKHSSINRTNQAQNDLSYNTILSKNKAVCSNRMTSNTNRFSNKIENTKPFSKKITLMLLCVSFMFLILTLPVVILYVMLEKLKQLADNSSDSDLNYYLLSIAQKATTLLMYLNHSINFFIYYLTGARFRQKFRNLIKRRKNSDKQIRYNYKNFNLYENGLKNRFITKKNSALYA